MAKYTYNPPYNQWSGNRSDTLNKWKVNYKGSIATASALPSKGEFKGDTYNVLEDGSNYMWNGTSWDKLDANTYVGATSEASGIRGLVPPATTSQIYSLLTGSGVWKSGTELGFAYDNTVVHLTGDETIIGVKTFKNSTSGNNPGSSLTDVVIRNSEVERGVLGEGRGYTRVILADNEGELEGTQAGRLALLEVMSPKKNDTIGANLRLGCYKYSSDPGDANVSVVLHIGYDTDGIAFAMAPSTSDDRADGKDIVTRDWIPKDSRIVHTTGDETISGKKTINTLNITDTGNLAGTVNSKVFYLCSGTENSGNNGAFITLCGSTSTYGSAGYFLLRAGTTAANTKTLQGQPDGTLTWDGQAIQTSSDERIKTPLIVVPDEVLDAWGDVQWGQFQYLEAVAEKGMSARLHLGLIAQKVKTVFEERGLDACSYGILCHEEREATEVVPAIDLWMVRYAEAQAMEAAYQRRRAERAEARIKALEDRLEALEAKLA